MQTSVLTTAATPQTNLPKSVSTAQKLEASISSFQSQLNSLTTTLRQSTASTSTTSEVGAESLLTVLSGFTNYLNELNTAIGSVAASGSASNATATDTPAVSGASAASKKSEEPISTQSASLTNAYKDIANAPDNASYYVVPVEYGGTSSSVRLDNYAYHQWLSQIADGKDPNSAALALSGDGIGTGSPRFEAGFSAQGYALGTGAIGADEAKDHWLALGGAAEDLNIAEFANSGSPYGGAFAAVKQDALTALLA